MGDKIHTNFVHKNKHLFGNSKEKGNFTGNSQKEKFLQQTTFVSKNNETHTQKEKSSSLNELKIIPLWMK